MMPQSLENSTKQDKILSTQTNQLSDAISAAVSFLLEARNPEGWWLDYNSLAFGPSDEWMTAYVAGILATVSDARVSEAIMGTWELLKSTQRPTGGWGYNSICIEDADTTGWVLNLAEAVGATDSEKVRQAKAFLATHQLPNEGMTAYANEEMTRNYFKIPPHISVEGFCGAHTCVSAAIATLPEFRFRLHDYLKATQTSQGYWQGYWWHDHEFTTAFAAEALAACRQAADQPCIDQAIAWGLKRLSPQGFVATSDHPDGSPFATALCLRLLLLDTVDPEVKAARAAATHWLLEQQGRNGAWISSARLRVPYFNDQDPNQFTQWKYHGMSPGSLNFDQNSIHTTATVLHSLQKAAEVPEK